MLLKYNVRGYKAFNEEVSLNLKGNRQIKNKDNVFVNKEGDILKSALIYGPNNTGKSSLIESLFYLKEIVLQGMINKEFICEPDYNYNFYNKEKCICYNIEFISNGDLFNYSLSINELIGVFDEVLYVNNKLIFDRNKKTEDEEMNNVIDLLSNYFDRLIISILPKKYKEYIDEILEFFKSITIINKNTNFTDVITGISNLNKEDFKKFNNIIKNADISIENIRLKELSNNEPYSNRLVSLYNMKDKKIEMTSLISDSDGTKAFMLYILKIIETMKNGGIIVIDEIDNSLHTLLTKSILSLFNNDKNKNMQLIATTHDLMLLDTLYLFRKDQIYFTYKDKKQVYMYSLNEFKANKNDQIRNKTVESYLKGLFGSLPRPNIEEYLYDEK